MTETEWLTGTDPVVMLASLYSHVSGRKLRLFAVGCCRRIWEQLDEGSRSTVELAERLADGLANPRKVKLARELPGKTGGEKEWNGGTAAAFAAAAESPRTAARYAARASRVAFSLPWIEASSALGRYEGDLTDPRPISDAVRAEMDAAGAAQAALLRDIFGNPFRPVAVDPAWRTSAVVALANGIYADRAFDRLPILADALQDAGCDEPDVLDHCRGDGPHVRGCWVVDLILGKT